MANDVIVCKNIKKSYETARGVVDVVKEFSLDVHQNEFLVLFGPGQCGKSTLMKVMSGLEAPTEGSVTLNGKKVTGPGPDRGFVYQRTSLFPWLTVMGNVEFGPKARGIGKKERREKAQYYIDLVGLTGFENSYPNQLSGGMQQRVGIARAFVSSPEIVFADEPTGNLDSKTTMEIMHLIKSMAREYNQTIVMVTHDVRLAEFADKVVHIHDGKINKIEERTEDVSMEGVEQ